MPKESAGVLLFRRSSGFVEVLLAHPGGPLWAKKDEHAWTIPKGQCEPGEAPIEAARRELEEETGIRVLRELVPLGQVKQRSGKIVHAWAVEQDFDPAALVCNPFQMEWPPRSKTMQEFPEVDRAQWFSIEAAREKILDGQAEFLDRLVALTAGAT
jgi:predicted NUDIX family NTP pyrophosphohydrolase